MCKSWSCFQDIREPNMQAILSAALLLPQSHFRTQQLKGGLQSKGLLKGQPACWLGAPSILVASHSLTFLRLPLPHEFIAFWGLLSSQSLCRSVDAERVVLGEPSYNGAQIKSFQRLHPSSCLLFDTPAFYSLAKVWQVHIPNSLFLVQSFVLA